MKAVVVGYDQVGREVLGREEAVAGSVDVRSPAKDGGRLVRVLQHPLARNPRLVGRTEVQVRRVAIGQCRVQNQHLVFVEAHRGHSGGLAAHQPLVSEGSHDAGRQVGVDEHDLVAVEATPGVNKAVDPPLAFPGQPAVAAGDALLEGPHEGQVTPLVNVTVRPLQVAVGEDSFQGYPAKWLSN